MKEYGRHSPLISEDAQARQMHRHVGAVHSFEYMNDPALADAARTQYLVNHPEPPLLAYVLCEGALWLQDLARRGVNLNLIIPDDGHS